MVFGATPISPDDEEEEPYGNVYVPTALVDSYKADAKWATISDRIVGY